MAAFTTWCRQVSTAHRFDSGIETLALTAPHRELEALNVSHEARYILGQDITDITVVAKLLNELGLVTAAARLTTGDKELSPINGDRRQHAQHLLQTYGITGVPNIVVTDKNGSRLLRSDALFSNLENILDLLAK